MEKPIDVFEEARKEYPGTKRGRDTEFKDFKRHRDWKEVLPLLLPAIRNQNRMWRIEHTATRFIPHFRTWLFQRRWEIELAEDTKRQDEKKREEAIQTKKDKETIKEYEPIYKSYSNDKLLKMLENKYYISHHWLIRRILQDRSRQLLVQATNSMKAVPKLGVNTNNERNRQHEMLRRK